MFSFMEFKIIHWPKVKCNLMSKRWCCGRLTCHQPDPSAVPLSSVKPPDLFFLSSFLLNARWDLSAPRNLSFPSWAPGSFSFWITNSPLLKVPCRWSSISLWPDDFPWSRAAAWSSSLFRCFFASLCLQPKDCMFFLFIRLFVFSHQLGWKRRGGLPFHRVKYWWASLHTETS